jgi:hypothetical protein
MAETPNKPETSLDKDRANHLEEWKQARHVLEFFDDKLHDLRKYGFGLVTALLTAEGILIPKTGDDVPVQIKFAVFFVTLLLILAVHLIDHNYRVYQRAANMRARVLERNLNLELSDTITDRYRSSVINLRVWSLYVIFIAGVLCLGGFSLFPNWAYIGALIGTALVAILLTTLLRLTFKYEYAEDWTISPLECGPTDKVTITLTNLGEPVKRRIPKWMQSKLEKIRKKKGMAGLPGQIELKPKEVYPDGKMMPEPIKFKEGYPVWEKVPEPIIIKKDALVWQMINEESGKSTLKTADSDIVIYDSHIWTLKKDDFGKSGTYRLRPRGWPLPLQRRIIVFDDTGKKTRKKGEIAGN